MKNYYDIKEEYLTYQKDVKGCSSSSVNRIRTTLNSLEKVASENNIFLLNATNEEIIYCISNIGTCVHLHLKNIINVINVYFKWIYDNNYIENEIDIKYFNIEDMDLSNSFRCSYHKDPKSFIKFIDSVSVKRSLGTIDNSQRTFLWLIYMGIEPKYTVEILKEDVNLKNGVINYEGKSYKIPREAIDDFKWSLENVSCVKYVNGGVCHTEFNDPTKLVGVGGKRAFLSMQYRVNHIQLNEEDKNKLIFKNIENSGLFYRMFIKEQSGDYLDFTFIADNKYESNNKYGNRFIKQYGKYLAYDYRDWKKAFWS